jgi:hypothetical protein
MTFAGTMPVKDMLLRFGARVYSVTRSLGGEYDEETGKYTPGATSALEIMASVQPLGPEQVASMPEGDRTRERFNFYSEAPLQLGDTTTGRKADVVRVGEFDYEAESVERWVAYTKSVIARVG